MRVPREGIYWLVASLIFLATGVLKGINLVSLLACFMLVAWLLNGLTARFYLRRVSLRQFVDTPVFAGEKTTVRMDLASTGRRTLASLDIVDQGTAHRKVWHLPWLRSGEPARLRHMIVAPRRGRYAFEPIRVSSSFPFGLVEGSVRRAGVGEVCVYPALGKLHARRLRQFLRHTPLTSGRSRRHPVRHPSAQSEFHGVRAFRSGDSPRWIHWRTTARHGELMVREFEETPTDNLVVILDPWRGEGNEAARVCLEHAISLVATLCWEWCRHGGDYLALAIAGPERFFQGGATNAEFGAVLLERLAVEKGAGAIAVESVLEPLARWRATEAPVLLVSTRAESFLESLAESLHRPVAFVNAAEIQRCDFYERPAIHGV